MNNATQTMGTDDGPAKCHLLGPFALFVQGALGALALLVLLWKRSRESPQRPLLIWFMDVSKQVLGAILVHMANLLLSMISSGTFSTEPSSSAMYDITPAAQTRLFRRDGEEEPDVPYSPNPCSFYLLNLGIDTTLGVVILIYLLRLFHKLFESCPIPGFRTGIVSGYYGEPPKWSYWAKQAAIYFLGLMCMKVVVAVLFAAFPWLGRVGDFLLSWTEGNRKLQVFFVMFFFPLVMNAFQYYVVDSFIKHQDPYQDVIRDGAPIDDEPDQHHPRDSFNYTEDDSDDNSHRRGLLERTSSRRSRKSASAGVEEFSPQLDGPNTERVPTPSSSSPSSGYFKSKREGTVRSAKSRNSSMMLLPGSRGPSTPGYDEEASTGARSVRGRPMFADDESTLVDGDRER